jgi:ketosteroid isomerase-like protein
MSQENEQLIRDGYEVFGRRDLASAPGFFHSRVVWRLLGEGVDAVGTYRGWEEIRDFWKLLWSPWDWLHIEPEEFIDLGSDRLAVFVRFRGRGSSTGIEVDQPAVHIHELRDGKMYRLDHYWDTEVGARAAGLEVPAHLHRLNF